MSRLKRLSLRGISSAYQLWNFDSEARVITASAEFGGHFSPYEIGSSNRSSLTRVKLLICLQIHLIPYGTVSILSIMVAKNVFAISMSMVSRGWMIAWTSALAAATSGGTPRGNEGGREPVSSSIC